MTAPIQKNNNSQNRESRSQSQREMGGDRGQSSRANAAPLMIEQRVQTLRESLESRADMRAAGQVREIVKEGRDNCKNWDSKDISQNTDIRYNREVNKMRENNKLPENANCKNTFEFQRAALVHVTRAELKSNLRDFDKFKRQGDLDNAAKSFNNIRQCNEILKKYPPSTGNRNEDLKRTSLYNGKTNSEKSNCKRDSISNLPNDWKDKVQTEIKEKDKPAAAVMQITGCRPAESKGVKIRQSNEKITFEIKGAKVDQDRGLPNRIVEFDKQELEESQAGRDVMQWMGDRGCRTTTYSGSLESFRERVNSAFQRAECEAGSCYSFRHDRATVLRSAGATPTEIARELGQRSPESQQVYGRR